MLTREAGVGRNNAIAVGAVTCGAELRRGLLDNGYSELSIISDHVVATESLPPIHKDPFDRVLVAQATVEGVTLLTTDSLVAQYPGPIKTV